MAFCKEFFENGVMGKSINSTFISLVPKKDRSKKVRDSQSISLVIRVCKIVSLFFDVVKFKNVLTFLQVFELVSGLCTNVSKSSVTRLNWSLVCYVAFLL